MLLFTYNMSSHVEVTMIKIVLLSRLGFHVVWITFLIIHNSEEKQWGQAHSRAKVSGEDTCYLIYLCDQALHMLI